MQTKLKKEIELERTRIKELIYTLYKWEYELHRRKKLGIWRWTINLYPYDNDPPIKMVFQEVLELRINILNLINEYLPNIENIRCCYMNFGRDD